MQVGYILLHGYMLYSLLHAATHGGQIQIYGS